MEYSIAAVEFGQGEHFVKCNLNDAIVILSFVTLFHDWNLMFLK